MADTMPTHKHAAVRVLGEAFFLEITKSETSCPRRRSSSCGLSLPCVSRGQAIAKLLGNGPTLARVTFFVCVIGGPQFVRQAGWGMPTQPDHPHRSSTTVRLSSYLYFRLSSYLYYR